MRTAADNSTGCNQYEPNWSATGTRDVDKTVMVKLT
jgi:hypothetical protein